AAGGECAGRARTPRPEFVKYFGLPPSTQTEDCMIGRVLPFVPLPLLLLAIFAVARFTLGAKGVPYAPRGNAMFSIVGLTFVSSFYFGALSRRVRGFGWGRALLPGSTTRLLG